jgi:flagellum-specific peptidoglycan hydrolase FlgJ
MLHSVALAILATSAWHALSIARPAPQPSIEAPATQAQVAHQTADTQPTSALPSAPPPASAQPPQTVAREPLPRVTEYTVKSGDTLRSIAAKFNVDLDVLVWSNDLIVPDLIRTEERIFVPPPSTLIHQVRAGDTLRSVAQVYEADLRKIIEINQLTSPDVIVVGQRLLVPGRVPLRPVPVPPQASRPTPIQSVEVVEGPQENQLEAAAVDMRPAPTPEPAPRTPQEAFIRSIAAPAQASRGATGVPASVTIAQAILESYWGTSRLAREANNYFGIKAKERPGTAGVMWIDAWEVLNGRNVIRREPFRAYASIADSFEDHARFFLQNGRYARAVAAMDEPRRFAQEIHRAGYATDPGYSTKLIGLMDQYNLYRYDR